jgi:hypothetical protein
VIKRMIGWRITTVALSAGVRLPPVATRKAAGKGRSSRGRVLGDEMRLCGDFVDSVRGGWDGDGRRGIFVVVRCRFIAGVVGSK